MAQTKINKTAARIFSGLHRRLYKLTGGRLGGKVQGGEIVLLRTTGRRSGKPRERPLIAGHHDDGWVVIASYSGHDEHPAWYLNLQADPAATVVLRGDETPVRARVVDGAERAELWEHMAGIYDDYNDYQAVTDREIPVVVLEQV